MSSFPELDNRHPVSYNGGVQPQWREDGKELYFIDLDGKLNAVDIDIDATGNIKSGDPQVLFDPQASMDFITLGARQYVATPDGERFLFLKPPDERISIPITVVLNWTGLSEQ